PVRNGPSNEEAARAAKGNRKSHANHANDEADQSATVQIVIREVRAAREVEQRSRPKKSAQRHKSHNRGNKRRHQRLVRQVVAIRHLKRERNSREWRAKHRRHASRGAADQHDAAVAAVEPQPPELGPQPRADGAAAVNARAFERRAAAYSNRGDGRDQLGEERAHVDVALMLVIGLDDLLGRVFVRVGRKVLHDEAGQRESAEHDRDNGPVMGEKKVQQSRPHFIEDDNDQRGCRQAGNHANQRRDQQPLFQIAGINRGEVLVDQGKVSAQQRMLQQPVLFLRCNCFRFVHLIRNFPLNSRSTPGFSVKSSCGFRRSAGSLSGGCRCSCHPSPGTSRNARISSWCILVSPERISRPFSVRETFTTRRSVTSCSRRTSPCCTARSTSPTTECGCSCRNSASSETVAEPRPVYPAMPSMSWCCWGVTPQRRAASSLKRRNLR